MSQLPAEIQDLNRSLSVHEETLSQTKDMALSAAGIQGSTPPKRYMLPAHTHVYRVACCDNGDMVIDGKGRGELYIIGGDGKRKMKLTTHEADEEKQIGVVYSITASVQGHILIIDASKYVKSFTSSGKYLRCFSMLTPNQDPNTNVDARCISVDKTGLVFIGDWARDIITIHRYPDGTLVNKVKCSIGWYFMAVNSKKQILYPFRSQYSVYNEVKAIDYTGNQVFTFIPKIDEDVTGGKVVDVGGIVCDADDNIYIAMQIAVKQSDTNKWHYIPNTGHIHMYSPEGNYKRCIASGIKCPRDLTFTPDHSQLVVANLDSVLTYSLPVNRMLACSDT